MRLFYDEFPDREIFDIPAYTGTSDNPLLAGLSVFGIKNKAVITQNNGIDALLVFKKQNTSNLSVIKHFADKNCFGLFPAITLFFSESLSDASGWSGRKWTACRGNLHLSLLLRPAIPFEKKYMHYLRIIVFNSIIQSLSRLVSPVLLKLPSDILVNKRKIGGIIEKGYGGFDIKALVFGIGLNINTLPQVKDLSIFIPGIDSVSNLTGKTYTLFPIIHNILTLLSSGLKDLHSDIRLVRKDFELFNQCLYGIGRTISLYRDKAPPVLIKRGIFSGTSEEGGLCFLDPLPHVFEPCESFRIPV